MLRWELRYGWDEEDQYYEYDPEEASQWELEGWVQDQRGDWVQDLELRDYYQARLGSKTTNKQHDSQNNLDGPLTAVSAVSDRNKKNSDRSVGSDNSDNNSDNYTIPYGEKGRNASPATKPSTNNPNMFNKVGGGSSRPKPADYDEAWYEETDGQWYNQYDWYQEESGDWSYDYRMEEYGYTQNQLGEWLPVDATKEKQKDQTAPAPPVTDKADKVSKTGKDDKEDPAKKSLEKAGSKDGFSQVFSSEKKPSLPARPPDYHDYWYQDETGAWYNEYDDLGFQFAEDDDDLLIVRPAPGTESQSGKKKVSQSKNLSAKKISSEYILLNFCKNISVLVSG